VIKTKVNLHKLAVVANLVLLSAFMIPAHGQAFPSKPIQLIVTGAPGASTDIIARRLGKVIQDQTGISIVVENKGGASGSIALLQTIRAPADGYRLVIAVPDSVTIYPLLKKTKPYVAEKDLTPIAQVAEAHFVFAVSATIPVNNLAEFITRAKGRLQATQLSYASPGNGTTARLVTEMFMARSGIKMLHVPYRSTIPGLVGVVGGETEIMATSIASAKAMVDSGQLKLIGITREQRLKEFQGIPTAIESGLENFVVPVWWGIFGPANLPVNVREKLTSIILNAARSDEMKSQLMALGLEPKSRGDEDFRAFLSKDTQMWQEVISKVDLPLED
jgi:tripartite-type tricarboxylate transporter receptor subunit TctC